ncbi:MAG: KH domain-containing protein [Thermoplasmatota archaeon]|jgi:ribosomal RNA assembly protein
MKYIKIPIDRIGVLIGQKGKTKKDIETISGVKLNIDSKQGEIEIDDRDVKDPLISIKIENVIRAIGRGFSPENAIRLMDDYVDFFIFDLHDYVGKKESHLRRIKSRIIGKEGKTKRVLENLTDSKISIYGHTVAIISELERMNILKKSIDMLLTGSKHATVYHFVEVQMKELRRFEKYGV